MLWALSQVCFDLNRYIDNFESYFVGFQHCCDSTLALGIFTLLLHYDYFTKTAKNMESILTNYEALIASYCESLGYLPRVSRSDNSKVQLRASEMAIIRPVEITAKEGVQKGRVTAEITLILIRNLTKIHMNQRVAQWDRVKEDAMSIVSGIELSGQVLKVSELEITPLSGNLSEYEEVSVEITASVVSNFRVGVEDSSESF